MQTATFPTYDTVDLFAGPGGWSLAARRLGLREIGIEFDKGAHLTRRAAGFHTIRDDVRQWGPANFPNARGLIASPPCPTFSAAGKGSGRKELDLVLGAIEGMYDYHQRGWQWFSPEWEDERTGLTLEALRWPLEAIRLGKPYEWLAFEQVPTVLPVWQAMADVLRAEGYSVAVGNLQAEQYGVPQTRKRAVLIAHYVHGFVGTEHEFVDLPKPTHSRYHTRDKARLDPGVLPWVSMAQALGWDGADVVRSNYGSGGDPSARGERTGNEPSATVTGKIDRNLRMAGAGQTAQDTAGQVPRTEGEPAHTITGKGTAAWVGEACGCDMRGAIAGRPSPAHRSDASGECEWFTERVAARFGNQEHSAVRAVDEPAATIRYGERMNANDWTFERPATTVVGSFNPDVIAAPGYRTSVADGSRQNAPGSVRVSVEEAGVLQSFPRDFPWQGSRTKQYQQVGNAIPPLLAEAVLRQVVG